MNRSKNKILALLILIFFIFGSGLMSCGDGFNCGPFDDKFKLTGLSGKILEVVYLAEPNETARFSELEGTLIHADRFAIEMQQNYSTYSWTDKSSNFGLISTVNACSPSVPRSEEVIDRIVITTTKNFNPEYPSGSDLSNIFDVIFYDDVNGITRSDLNDFIATGPNVPHSWYLALKEGPTSTTDFQFYVQYYQQGIDTDFFEFTTRNILIEP